MPQMLYDDHYGIYEAIAKQKPKLARQRMQEHLTMIEEAMLEIKKGNIAALKQYRRIPPEHKIKEDFVFPS
jgi:GntR family transcriptional repressor for pyruvate dehydrogenase complex